MRKKKRSADWSNFAEPFRLRFSNVSLLSVHTAIALCLGYRTGTNELPWFYFAVSLPAW